MAIVFNFIIKINFKFDFKISNSLYHMIILYYIDFFW